MAEIVEKRRFGRFKFQEEVRIFPVHPSASGDIYEVQKSSIEARALDVSEGGLRLQWAEDLRRALLLKLNFCFSQGNPVEIYAKVVWTTDQECGVKFMVPDAAIQHGVRSLSSQNA